MPARRVHDADRAVIKACAERGVQDITARKLERWRRCLPDRAVEHRPGLRGSRTTNPPGYIDHVLALDELLKTGVTLRVAPRRLFAQGFPVKLEVLRQSYMDLYGTVDRGLHNGSGLNNPAGSDPADRADALAVAHVDGMRRTQLGRLWVKRAERLVASGGVAAGDTARALVASALSVMFAWFIAGVPPSDDGVVEALDVAGLNDGQDPAATANHLASLNLQAMIAAIAEATEGEWSTARKAIETLAQYVEQRRTVELRWRPDHPLSDGLGNIGLDNPDVRSDLIPVALLLGTPWRQGLAEEHRLYSAIGRLLEELPEKFHPFIRLDGGSRLEDQPDNFRAELGSCLDRWARAHPEHARTLSEKFG